MLTPAEVHHGRGADVLELRHQVMMRAFNANPKRFHDQAPKMQELPNAVWINKPVEEEVREALRNVV